MTHEREQWAVFPIANATQAGEALARYREAFGASPAEALVSRKTGQRVLQTLRNAGLKVSEQPYVLAWEIWLGPATPQSASGTAPFHEEQLPLFEEVGA